MQSDNTFYFLSLVLQVLVDKKKREREACAKCFRNTGKGFVLSAGGEGEAVSGKVSLRK